MRTSLSHVTRSGLTCVALLVGGQSLAQRTPDRAGQLFETLAGSWTGAGTVRLASGTERIRCRAAYSPYGATRLHLDLRCAGDSFTLQVQSDITREGDRVSGTWSETTFGISGELSGSVGANAIRATVGGMGVSAELSLALRGNVQAVTLTSQSAIASSASVTLRRG